MSSDAGGFFRALLNIACNINIFYFYLLPFTYLFRRKYQAAKRLNLATLVHKHAGDFKQWAIHTIKIFLRKKNVKHHLRKKYDCLTTNFDVGHNANSAILYTYTEDVENWLPIDLNCTLCSISGMVILNH